MVMSFLGFSVDQYVVQVGFYANVQHVREYVVHHLLERGWCVGESKWHYLEFE